MVVDNTNATLQNRVGPIAQGKAAGATIIGYYFSSQLQECLDRNSRREGLARVPDIALSVTLGRLWPPALDEGFDHLYFVHIGEDGNYVVEDWDPGP